MGSCALNLKNIFRPKLFALSCRQDRAIAPVFFQGVNVFFAEQKIDIVYPAHISAGDLRRRTADEQPVVTNNWRRLGNQRK